MSFLGEVAADRANCPATILDVRGLGDVRVDYVLLMNGGAVYTDEHGLVRYLPGSSFRSIVWNPEDRRT